MRKCVLTVLLLSTIAYAAMAQVVDNKIFDNGSSGPYKAMAASEATHPDYVVYRPQNIKAAFKSEARLPIIVFGNGGCAITSITHERVLSEIASHGYVVLAIGALEKEPGREYIRTQSSMLVEAMDWMIAQSKNKQNEFYKLVDTDKIALMGQFCGGVQTLYASADPKVKTSVMFNSGIGDMTMAGADKVSLKALHAPIIYIIGGPSDIAYVNAELDYERIIHIPVIVTNYDSGHMGTFGEEFGGAFSKMVLAWLDWQFKSKKGNAVFFQGNNTTGFEGWTVKAENF